MKLIDPPVERAEAVPAEASVGFAVYVATVAAVGGLLFGYDSAVINGAVGAIGTHLNAGPTSLGSRSPLLRVW